MTVIRRPVLVRAKYLALLFMSTLFFYCTIILLESPSYTVTPEDALVEFGRKNRTRKILLWNSFFGDDSYEFGKGYEPFIRAKCVVSDCYITSDKSWMPVQYFDAIVFHGPEYHPQYSWDRPSDRLQFQRYIYASGESPSNRPVDDGLDGFFNWTMTYRIDSDLPDFYFGVFSKDGKFVAPSDKPMWTSSNDGSSGDGVARTKTKPVAWFVSNCQTPNAREELVQQLSKHVEVDVYGRCGDLTCSRDDSEVCFDLLKDNYFFYLAFENSNCEDYVTEKVFNAFQNDVVPIVYGGADYSKFLPPDSYIDASLYPPDELSQIIYYYASNPEQYYRKFFGWREHYRVSELKSKFCRLCQMLHDDSLPEKSYDIKKWWHGDEVHPMCTW